MADDRLGYRKASGGGAGKAIVLLVLVLVLIAGGLAAVGAISNP